MKKKIITVIIITVTLFITGFLFLVNDVIISIRLSDLKVYLQNLDQDEGSIDHIGLIANYEIHKKIYENRITQEKADIIENRISSLSVQPEDGSGLLPEPYGILSLPAIRLINFNRSVIGKKPLKYRKDKDKNFSEVDIAYYYERNYLFEKAISSYDKALENNNLSDNLRASILLRQGYCYAMTDLHEKAEKNYKTVIEKYSHENSSITAVILLRYLSGFMQERDRVLSGKLDPVARSRKLVNLFAYKQALKVIDEIEQKAVPRDIPHIMYYKARCYSGIGKPERAFELFKKVIRKYPHSQYAKYSNRKIFLIGSAAGGDNKIIEASKELNRKLKDPVLKEMIKEQKNKLELKFTIEYLEDTGNSEESKQKPESGEKTPDIQIDKTIISEKNPYLVINTSDGNTFKGTLIEQNKSYIALQTSIGRINVKRDKVTQIKTK